MNQAQKNKFNKQISPILIFSGVVLGLILAFGFNFAGSAPPTDNLDPIVHTGPDEQIKEGPLGVNRATQKDQTAYPGATNRIWELMAPGDEYAGDEYAAWFKGLDTLTNLRGWDIIAYEHLWAMGDLKVEGHISAPNQNWEDTKIASKYTTPNTAMIYCDDGWYLFKVQVSDDGVSSEGWCASPFKKESTEGPFGGGGRVGDKLKRGDYDYIGDWEWDDW